MPPITFMDDDFLGVDPTQDDFIVIIMEIENVRTVKFK